MGSVTWTTTTKDNLATTNTGHLIWQQQEPMLEPLLWHPFLGGQPTSYQINYISPLPSGKGQCFVLVGTDTYSGYRFVFPACSASAETTTRGLAECLGQRTHITVKEVWHLAWPRLIEFTGLSLFLTIMRQLVWQNSVIAFWRLSYSDNTLWKYLAGLRNGSLADCICFESVSNMCAILPWPGSMGQGIKGWKWEWHLSLLFLVTHYQNSCFLSPCLIVCWPRGLSFRGRSNLALRCNSDYIELEVKTAIWLLWAPCASESTGKAGSYGKHWLKC